MNISSSNYSNYPAGYSINPISRIKSQSSGTGSKNELQPKSATNAAYPNIGTANQTDPNQTVPNQTNPGRANPTQENSDQEKQAQQTTSVNGHELTQAEMQLVKSLKQVDSEVRAHEMAHVAAGGRFITSGANFSYKKGPDGINYAVGGEVSIDTSPIPGDPGATIKKMRQVKTAALAPASPSPQDLRVASKASSMATKALSDLMIQTAKDQAESNEKAAFGNLKKAAESYAKVNNLPETDTATFQIAV